MSENINPETQSDVLDYSGKSLSELSELFHQFAISADRLQHSKEAEALKSAFYKTLTKEKEKLEDAAENVFDAVEEGFKNLYSTYKKEKAEYNRQLDAQKEDNLKAKLSVIEDLKALLEKDEDVTATFPALREIQDKWKAIGAIPMQSVRDINQTYQLYVEQFYDKLKINRELRDLDFKKNLELKLELCEKAEQLAKEENVLESFRQLQQLHDAWKDLGPVAKQYRDEIWERFKTATAAVNKGYQAYFEQVKGEQANNLSLKEALCEKVEEIAEREITDSKLWNSLSKDIESIQAEWRKIGYATKKENQKVYDRFRAACDKFYERKRVFYSDLKGGMEENLQKKLDICEAAEQLKSSTEWKEATEKFLELQKQWKEIGVVPRKKSEAVWKRFRAACDEFFAEKEKNVKPAENDFYANLKAKQRIIDQINSYELTGDNEKDQNAYNELTSAFNALGFVPFKEKDKIAKAYKEAVAKTFSAFVQVKQRAGRGAAKVVSEKDRLLASYRSLQQEIATKENNILFFANSKGNALVEQMKESIEQAKKELADLEQKIREIE